MVAGWPMRARLGRSPRSRTGRPGDALVGQVDWRGTLRPCGRGAGSRRSGWGCRRIVRPIRRRCRTRSAAGRAVAGMCRGRVSSGSGVMPREHSCCSVGVDQPCLEVLPGVLRAGSLTWMTIRRTPSDATMSAVPEVAGSLVGRGEGSARACRGTGKMLPRMRTGGEARGGGGHRHEQSAPARRRQRRWAASSSSSSSAVMACHTRGGGSGSVAGSVVPSRAMSTVA